MHKELALSLIDGLRDVVMAAPATRVAETCVPIFSKRANDSLFPEDLTRIGNKILLVKMTRALLDTGLIEAKYMIDGCIALSPGSLETYTFHGTEPHPSRPFKVRYTVADVLKLSYALAPWGIDVMIRPT